MVHLQDRLKSSQVSFEVQPRVFYEGFPGLVLYVQNVKAAQGAAIWKGVFIADTSIPSSPRITLAQQGILVSEGPETLHLHLTDGSTHEIDPEDSRSLPDFHLRANGHPHSGTPSRQREGAGPRAGFANGDLGPLAAGQ